MTHVPHKIARFAFLALAVASLATAACGPPWTCECPGPGVVAFSGWLAPGRIASVSEGSTCTTKVLGPSTVEVTTHTGETCVFTAQFEGGEVIRASVMFTSYEGNQCCAGVYIIYRDPVFERVSDGSDGGA